ncbi:MAG: hypothetical protein PHD72_00345 [Patescibacteria group bacterium]|nr:hypothetical protein [Patescibacteria group bacterium]
MSKKRLAIIFVCVVVAVVVFLYFWPRPIAKDYLANSVTVHGVFDFDCAQDDDCYIVRNDIGLDCRDYDCGVGEGCFDSNDPDYLSINFKKYSQKLKELCDTPERLADMQARPEEYGCTLGLAYCPDSDTSYRPACREGKCVKVKSPAPSDAYFADQFYRAVIKE